MLRRVKICKQIVKIFLSILMVITVMPTNVFAMDEGIEEEHKNAEMNFDIKEQFSVNDKEEFTLHINANDDKGKEGNLVFSFSDEEAVSGLQYWDEVLKRWVYLQTDYELKDKLELIDSDYKFRVSFKSAGKFKIQAAVVDLDTREEICASEANVTVKDRFNVSVIKNVEDGGEILLDGEKREFLQVDEDTDVKLTINASENYKIQSIQVNNNDISGVEGKDSYSDIITVQENTEIVVNFIRIWTVNVSYDSKDGIVYMDSQVISGSVDIHEGKMFTLRAQPHHGYRVSEVDITVNSVTNKTHFNENDFVYEKKFNTKNNYNFKITFARNIYQVDVVKGPHGEVKTVQSVQHDDSFKVYLEPDVGYTVDNITVNGSKITEIIKEDGKIYFELYHVDKNQIIDVKFKQISKAEKNQIDINDEQALRVNEDKTLYVIDSDSEIVIKSIHDIRLYTKSGEVFQGNNENDHSISIHNTCTINRVEVYYRAEDELYEEWHEVDIDGFTIAVDQGDVKAVLNVISESTDYGYYNDDVQFEVKAIDGGVYYSGLQSVSYWITIDGIKQKEILLYSHKDEIRTSYDNDSLTVNAEMYNSSDVSITVKVVDRAGNESYNDKKIKINSTAPKIHLEITNDNSKSAVEGYYNKDRTLTITVLDREDTFNPDTVNMIVNEEKVNKSDIAWTNDGNVHVGIYKFDEEKEYEWTISYINKAGLSPETIDAPTNQSIYHFIIDKTAPSDLDVVVNKKSVLGTNENFAFDTFFDTKIVVKLTASGGLSGLQSMKYQKVESLSEFVDSEDKWIAYDENEGIIVSPNEKFVLYFRAEDKAGNVSIVHSTGIVVDNQKPVGEVHAPDIDIEPETANKNGFHNSDVSVKLNVIDPRYAGTEPSEIGFYSGLNRITYKIYTKDTDAVEEGVLFDLRDKKDGANYDKDGLAYSWSGKITINSNKFNSNNVIIQVTATDNAGNTRITSTLQGEIKIDVTKPRIKVEYSNNAVDSSSYFKSGRKATIIITERNFNADDVDIHITNSDGKSPTLSKWRKINGTGNKDNTKWQATVSYDKDGDYTFSIGYSDLAGWTCAKENVDYGENRAPIRFTIDKTKPTIKVTYDNNSAVNSNYYKSNRVATIEINEHNLDPNGADKNRINISLNATDDGKAISIPKVSAWKTSGNKHTATIRYDEDGLYTFDISVIDKAGNISAKFTQQKFYIDKTAPKLEISGVKDNSANKGDVIPVISYSDTNYDADKVSISLTGANRKSVKLDGKYTDTHNGRTFTFKNFAKEQEMDDIYTLSATLTDKAGNTTTKNIVFSVNRFGSTYALSEASEKLNGTYVKKPIDVVVTETNTDRLSNIKVTLFKDGETISLKEGKDYRIDLTGGNGQWYHYTYTILSKNFIKDGAYSLTIESDDAAGNKSENNQDVKNTAISFGVDNTLPIININNLISGTTYAVDSFDVEMSITDNLKLAKVIVELDGKVIKTWSDLELENIIKNGGNFIFTIDSDSINAHTLVVYAIDAAGNGEKISKVDLPENAETVDHFYVTTNLWIRFYTNKPLFFGSIAAIIIVSSLIAFLVKRKKSGLTNASAEE